MDNVILRAEASEARHEVTSAQNAKTIERSLRENMKDLEEENEAFRGEIVSLVEAESKWQDKLLRAKVENKAVMANNEQFRRAVKSLTRQYFHVRKEVQRHCQSLEESMKPTFVDESTVGQDQADLESRMLQIIEDRSVDATYESEASESQAKGSK